MKSAIQNFKNILLFCFIATSTFSQNFNKKNPSAPYINSINVNSCKNLCNYFSGNSSKLVSLNSTTINAVIQNEDCFNIPSNSNFSCLSKINNQSWILIKAKSNGRIDFKFTNSNGADVDAAIWHNVNADFTNICSVLQNEPISCDYSSIEPEVTIFNAIEGQYYLLLLANYSNSPTEITLSQPVIGQVEYILACPKNIHINESSVANISYWAQNAIISSGAVSSNVLYKANNSIVLKEGFKVENGNTFLAEIKNCDLVSSDNNILGFKIGTKNFLINETSNFIYSVCDTIVNGFASPIITVSPGATISPASGSSQNFSNPVIYTVTAIDGSIKTYTVNLNCLENKLIAFYPFNGNVLDVSGNGHHGNAQDVVSSADRNGNLNSSYYFNGTSASVVIPNHSDLILGNSNTKEFSISVWFKADLYQNNLNSNWIAAHLIHKGAGESQSQDYSLSFGTVSSNSNKFYWATGWATDNCSFLSFTPPNREAWHHMVVTYSAITHKKNVYIDGSLVTTCNFSVLPVNLDRDIFIGKGVVFQYEATMFYKGYIDDIRFYNKVLTSQEVSYLNSI
jgi:hypothetical protein